MSHVLVLNPKGELEFRNFEDLKADVKKYTKKHQTGLMQYVAKKFHKDTMNTHINTSVKRIQTDIDNHIRAYENGIVSELNREWGRHDPGLKGEMNTRCNKSEGNSNCGCPGKHGKSVNCR